MNDARRRAIIFTVIALVLAAFAGILFIQRVGEVEAQLGNFVTVYVAKKDIGSRQPLSAGDFEAKKIPAKYVAQSVVTDLKKIGNYGSIDKFVAVAPLKEGDVLTYNLLKPADDYTTGDRRLVQVPSSNRVAFDQALEANDRVDIIVSWNENDIPAGEKRTSVFMKDVLVASVLPSSKDKFTGVWLEMSLDEARKFIDAQNFAQSVRILKAPTEQRSSQTEGKSSTAGVQP